VKNRFKITSVRGKISLLFIVVVLLSILVGTLIVSRVVEGYITANYEVAKATTVEGLSYALEPMLESHDYDLVERLIRAILKHRYIASIAVYDINGTLISSVEEEAAASATVNLETYTISGDGGIVGSLEVGLYTGYISDQVRSTALTLIFGLLAISAVATLVLFGLFNRFVTRPLIYLNEKVTEMTPENLTVRIEQTREDEFGTLAKNINEMAKKLQEYDVSRKQAEEAIKQSEERFRIVFEYAPDAYYLNDLEGNFVDGNKVAEKLSGYKKEELIGKSFLNLNMLHPQDIRRAAELLIKNANGQSTGPDEFSLTRKDGSEVIVEISTFPVKIRGQALVLAIARDITERKRAEEALRQSEERHRIILEEIEDSYFEVDLGGHITFINSAGCRHLGYSMEELIGKKMSYKVFTDEEYIERIFQIYNEVYRTGVPNKGFQWKIIRKDGSARFIDSSVSPLRNDKGEIIGFRGVGRDITERKQMEEQLIITDRLASVGELASGIAHELNNPLTGIIGLSQLLVEKDIPEDSKEDLQLVYSEAQRAANVVKGLLTFARKHPPERQLININDVINKVLELRAYEQKVSNIKTITNLAPDLSEIWADFFQLQQVFLNIVTNAEYFMLKAHNRGTLTITTEMVGGIVRISFADDGPGISQKDLGHVFDPFFTTKEVGQGTGLGLSISHGIVTAHCGRIYAETEQGKGATFVVELPVRQKEGPYEESD
jgi:PAS domain S-box-containing protein